MTNLKLNSLKKVLSVSAVAPFILMGCDSSSGVSNVGGTPVTASATGISIVTPIITLINNSQTTANCAYYITRPNGEPYGQTINKQAKDIKTGSSVTWNYIDTISDYENGKSFTSTTKTSICSYNMGWGLLGSGSEEGAYYITHNTESNTLTFVGYGLQNSKTTVSCSNSKGQVISQVLTNDNYSEFTCYLDKSPNVTVTMAGDLSRGKNLMNQQVEEQDNKSFTQGIGVEANSIIDNNTGLMWVKDLKTVPVIGSQNGSIAGNIPATSYQNALLTINEMNKSNYAGHNDWKLPSVNEIASLINYTAKNPQTYLMTKGFTNLAPGDGVYWTSTSFAPNEEAPWAGYNWTAMMSETGKGRTAFSVGTYSQKVAQPSALYIWPVRSTMSTDTAPKAVIQTGYKNSTGKAWPNPRFVEDVSGQCITDKLTGLTWIKDQKALKTIGGSQVLALYKDAKATVDKMNQTGFCGVKDWHLPSVNELSSLVNYTKPDFALWLNSQGFNMHNAGNYWNSFWTGNSVAEPVSPGYPARIWYMNSDGEFTYGIQSNMFNVFPVTNARVSEGKAIVPSTPTIYATPQKYPVGIGGYTVGTTVLGRNNKQYICLVEAACNYTYSDYYYDPVVGEWASFAWKTEDTTVSKYPYFPKGIGSYVGGTIVINVDGDYFKCIESKSCNYGDAYDTPVDKFPNNMVWQKLSKADLEPKVVPTPIPTVAPSPVPTSAPSSQYPEYTANNGRYVKGTIVTENGNQYRCLVADYCNGGAAWFEPGMGSSTKSAWELVNYKSYAIDTVFPVYPEGKASYNEGDIVLINNKQYRCINTVACRSAYTGYAPTASYGDTAWSPVSSITQVYPAGIGSYFVGDVVIARDGNQYRCKDKSGCNYNNSKYYDPVDGTYSTTAWTKIS